MTWQQALQYCLVLNRSVLDKTGQPHWIELDSERYHDGCLSPFLKPRLCSESAAPPFSPQLEPYTKKKVEIK